MMNMLINRRGSIAMNSSRSFGQGGFTLIELMIVVGVIAVLTLIAYPSYQTAVRKGRRGDAKSDLVQIGQALERCFTSNNSYSLACTGVTTGPNAIAANLSTSPQTGSPINYNIALTNNARLTYTITATPVAGSDQAKDTCGALSIDQTGTKLPVTGLDNSTSCW